MVNVLKMLLMIIVYFGPSILSFYLRNTKFKYYITILLGIVLLGLIIQLVISNFDIDIVIRDGFVIPLILLQLGITFSIAHKSKQ